MMSFSMFEVKCCLPTLASLPHIDTKGFYLDEYDEAVRYFKEKKNEKLYASVEMFYVNKERIEL